MTQVGSGCLTEAVALLERDESLRNFNKLLRIRTLKDHEPVVTEYQRSLQIEGALTQTKSCMYAGQDRLRARPLGRRDAVVLLLGGAELAALPLRCVSASESIGVFPSVREVSADRVFWSAHQLGRQRTGGGPVLYTLFRLSNVLTHTDSVKRPVYGSSAGHRR